VHGGVLTVIAPAPVVNGTRPQTRYSYSLLNGEYQLTGTSTCVSGAAPACLSTADEVKSSLGYDARGNVSTASTQNGTGTLVAATAMTYDAMGNLLTVDGPLSGTADTIRYRYDAARRRIGTVSADPDGAGALLPRAERMVLRDDGTPLRIETGTPCRSPTMRWGGS
jgi:hypothetical protein